MSTGVTGWRTSSPFYFLLYSKKKKVLESWKFLTLTDLHVLGYPKHDFDHF